LLSRLPRTANVWREMRSNAAGKKVSNLTGISVLLLRFEFDDESLPEQDPSPIGCRAAGIYFFFILQTEQEQISFHGLEDCWRTEMFLKHLRPEFRNE
jgi:hypothetical protein